MPDGLTAVVDTNSWSREGWLLPQVPGIFRAISRLGHVSTEEMYRVFNMGLGMLAVVGAAKADKVPEHLGSLEIRWVGEITTGNKTVDLH